MHVRPATAADLDRVSQMAAELVRVHHALDPERFLLAKGIERGYREWLAGQLEKDGVMLFVAEDDHELLGYVLGRREGRNWMKLLDAHVALIDIFVEPGARRKGVADALVTALLEGADAMGIPRVILETAARNEAAQALFAKHGFAPSAIEMMRLRAP